MTDTMTVKPDPLLYPKHIECPHKGCGRRAKVEFRYDQIEGWYACVEEHVIVDVQCTFDARKACRVEYSCPAALARVSPWEAVR